MTGLLRFAHVILRGVMAFPLEPRLEYGLHGLDQTTIDLPKCSIRFVRRQEGPPNITHVVCLVVSPWRVPLRVSCSLLRVALRHYVCWKIVPTTIAYGSQYLSLKTRGTDLNLPVANLLATYRTTLLASSGWYWGSHESAIIGKQNPILHSYCLAVTATTLEPRKNQKQKSMDDSYLLHGPWQIIAKVQGSDGRQGDKWQCSTTTADWITQSQTVCCLVEKQVEMEASKRR